MKEHKHVYKHDTTRVHKREGFIFVRCECGQKGQASTLANGNWRQEDVFTTRRWNGGSNVISFRANDRRYRAWKEHRDELVENFNKSLDKF